MMPTYGDYERAYEQALNEELERKHPGWDRQSFWLGFRRGWEARLAFALKATGWDSSDSEFALLRHELDGREEGMRRARDSVIGMLRGRERDRKTIERQATMIREAGRDPSDAPLWRRIAMQRRELRRLRRRELELMGRVAELEGQLDSAP